MKSKRRIQPVPPGDFLREELAERGISMNRLSRDIRIPLSRVSLIVNASPAKEAVIVFPWVRWTWIDPFCPPKDAVIGYDSSIPIGDLLKTSYPRLR